MPVCNIDFIVKVHPGNYFPHAQVWIEIIATVVKRRFSAVNSGHQFSGLCIVDHLFKSDFWLSRFNRSRV